MYSKAISDVLTMIEKNMQTLCCQTYFKIVVGYKITYIYKLFLLIIMDLKTLWKAGTDLLLLLPEAKAVFNVPPPLPNHKNLSTNALYDMSRGGTPVGWCPGQSAFATPL